MSSISGGRTLSPVYKQERNNMPTSSEIETQLNQQSADYLKRLEAGGQLPTLVSEAWKKADAGGTAALNTQEGDLLKNYVAAGANNRAKYADVWDPFARDKLAANATAMSYAPIADVRKELAMRADSLGIATNAAVSTYNAGTDVAKTNLGFTSDAYNRALQRETADQQRRDAAAAAAASAAQHASDQAFTASENQKSRDAAAVKAAATKDPGYKFIVKDLAQGGGLSTLDKTGKPITLNTYISGYAQDYSPADFIPYLSRSGDAGDKRIIQDIQSGLSTAELVKKYPWVFGG